MLEVCLCKPAIYKIRSLGRGKFEYYKSIGDGLGGGEHHKKRGDQIFKVQWHGGGGGGGSKRGDTIFDLDLGGEKPWRKLCICRGYLLFRG